MPRFPLAIVASMAVWAAALSPASASGERLPDVAALPAPSPPAWIVEISPSGQAATTTQVRVRFASPIVPLTGTDPSRLQPILAHFSIYPAMPGAFRIVSPRVVVFDAYRNFPISTCLRVEIGAGLTDVRGDRLSKSLAWTFETEPLSIEAYGPNDLSHRGPITMHANTAVELPSLIPRVTFTDMTTHATIPIVIYIDGQQSMWRPVPLEQSTAAGQPEDVGSEGGSYIITPLSPLRLSTTYEVDIQSGVRALVGNMPLASPQNSAMRTADPLRFLQLERFDSNSQRSHRRSEAVALLHFGVRRRANSDRRDACTNGARGTEDRSPR